MSNTTSVARTDTGQTHVNTTRVPLERRLIVLAQGKQFTNADLPRLWRMPDTLLLSGAERKAIVEEDVARWQFLLNSRKPSNTAPAAVKAAWNKENLNLTERVRKWRLCNKPLESHSRIDLVRDKPGRDVWIYNNLKQGVRYELRVVRSKQAFIDSLNNPAVSALFSGVHVVYGGHARYGRGPCFGTLAPIGRTDLPGDEWESGAGFQPNQPNNTGIFRLGYPYISVPAEEIFEHGYRATLATDSSALKKDTCDPELWDNNWAFSAKRKKGTLAKIQSLIPKDLPTKHLPCPQCGTSAHLLSKHVVDRNHAVPADTTEYLYYYDGKGELHVVLDAGWKATKSAPDDLGSKPLACKVFCHFGCSSKKHNLRIIREFSGWKPSGDNRLHVLYDRRLV